MKFSIIGDGPLWKGIQLKIKEEKIKNIKLLGERKNIFQFLYSADIFLSTSLYEGLPISILEAMSIGLPIVASDVTGNCDVIENGKSGFLYELKDINMAVYYLKKLSCDYILRDKIGNLAFQRQRYIFSTDLMICKYKKLYKNQKN